MDTNRRQEGLQLLGKETDYAATYAPEVLETFQNRHPENDYWALSLQAFALLQASQISQR